MIFHHSPIISLSCLIHRNCWSDTPDDREKQTDAGHTRDHYDKAMDRLYEAATKEVVRRTRQGRHERMQPSQRDTEGTAGKGLTAVVLLDPFLPDEDPTIYSELVPDPVSGEDYQIRECSFRTDCSWTSAINETVTQADDSAGLKREGMTGLPCSSERTSYLIHVFINKALKWIAAVTVGLAREISRWVEKGSGPSGTMSFHIKKLKTAYRDWLEYRSSVRLKRTSFALTPWEIKTKKAIRLEFLSMIDRLGLGPADLIVLPQINPLKLGALADAIQERGVYRIPHLKLVFNTSILCGKPSNREVLRQTEQGHRIVSRDV